MYKKDTYKILTNERIGVNTMQMRLEGPTQYLTKPGQFVEIAIPSFTLRRPISVCDVESDSFTIVYDIVGDGTEEMASMQPGTMLDILTGLGNGFDTDRCGKNPVLLGGGVGCPPIYNLAKRLIELGYKPTVILGFNSEERIIMRDMFESLGIPFHIATVDGSFGTPGYVTDVIAQKGLTPDYFYACGPLPMLKALCLSLPIPGQVSLESRMGCGFGVCMCCSLETRSGAKRICKDGPVFEKDELIWK